MTYINSCVILQPSGLYKATIRYSTLYFFTSEEHDSFRTLGEAQLWILKQRCPSHSELVEEEHQHQPEEEKVTEIECDAFENDSEDEIVISDSDTNSVQQRRKNRLNRLFNDIKKKNRRGYGKIYKVE